MAAVPPEPKTVFVFIISAKVDGILGPCQTPQKVTSCDMLPSQLNFSGSKVAALFWKIASIAAEELNIASAVPSRGAERARKLAAVKDPAPGILETVIVGSPGMRLPMWRLKTRIFASYPPPGGKPTMRETVRF